MVKKYFSIVGVKNVEIFTRINGRQINKMNEKFLSRISNDILKRKIKISLKLLLHVAQHEKSDPCQDRSSKAWNKCGLSQNFNGDCKEMKRRQSNHCFVKHRPIKTSRSQINLSKVTLSIGIESPIQKPQSKGKIIKKLGTKMRPNDSHSIRMSKALKGSRKQKNGRRSQSLANAQCNLSQKMPSFNQVLKPSSTSKLNEQKVSQKIKGRYEKEIIITPSPCQTKHQKFLLKEDNHRFEGIDEYTQSLESRLNIILETMRKRYLSKP